MRSWMANRNALKPGRYAAEAMARRRVTTALLKEARALLTGLDM